MSELLIYILSIAGVIAAIGLLQWLRLSPKTIRPALLFLAAIIPVAIFGLRGSFFQIILSFFVVVLFLLPLFVICGIGFIWNFARRQTIPPWIGLGSLLGFACAGTLVISYFLGTKLAAYDQREAEDFVAAATPILDGEKKRTGSYPADLNLVSNLPPRPFLLRPSRTYRSDGTNFFFNYSDPRSFWDDYYFSSQDRKWYHSD